ncbi:MAG: 50S ribosomal protein L18 [Chlamydiota bacterium]|nr:50S ribosomal protein L18 [Chlamydiota bacterium]
MKVVSERQILRWKRRKRIRKKITGTSERPRLSVFRSHLHMHIQLIDDVEGKTLLGVSTLAKDVRSQINNCGGVEAARVLGKYIALKAKEKGITKVVFDRGGYQFKGRVEAFAKAVREDGLEF